jgi:diamine N-acetyltransferase
MPKDVRLEDVTAQNWRAVLRLKLADDQQRLLASNAYSIAQSKYDEAAQPRAIYAGDRVVGFLMYDVPEVDDDEQHVSIYRFMIDKDHQGKGYGRAALTMAIEEIRQIPGITKDPDLLCAQQRQGEGFLRRVRLRRARRRSRRLRTLRRARAVSDAVDPALQTAMQSLDVAGHPGRPSRDPARR